VAEQGQGKGSNRNKGHPDQSETHDKNLRGEGERKKTCKINCTRKPEGGGQESKVV